MAKRIVVGPEVVKYVERINKKQDGYGWAVGIGVERDGQIIGGIVYHENNGANIFIHVASETPGWINREFLHVIFSYAFDQLKVKRVSGIVSESNTVALKFDLDVGFVIESRMKDAHPQGDLLVIKMTRDICRWINPKYQTCGKGT